MRGEPSRGCPAVGSAAWLAAALALAAAAGAQQPAPFVEYAREDPAKIVTAEACGECHLSEHAVWKKTPHASGFKTLHRKETAEAIAGKLGFRLIKRQSFCFGCHYTAVLEEGEVEVVSGVSCESCHGAARDWIDHHNKYGADATFATESPEHRRARIEKSRAAGMRRPSDLYPVVANCFACHTVPNEELVNVGGHSTGSAGFEFVAWSQGELRHNFLDSLQRRSEPLNAERPAERKRTMYVAGRALDLEYSLRGAAAATKPGLYAKAMTRRVRSATAEIRAIARSVEHPEVAAMVEAVRGVRVVPGNRADLLAAAEAVGRSTRRFLAAHDPMRMAALDPLVEGRGEVVGGEEQLAELDGDEEEADGGAAGAGTGAAAGGVGAAAEKVAEGTGSGVAAAAGGGAAGGGGGVAVEGRLKQRIRPAAEHRTLGPGACSGCHAPQNEWWFNHEHFRSADPFFDGESANVRIARLYGIKPSEMTRGRHLCMDCHGTIVSGKESREVLDGVGCESCHGPAADWLEPHKTDEQKQGRARPGYAEALRQGKRDLRPLETRTAVCGGCHYVTDSRLISAGHPSGADFDYAAAMREVRHWQAPLEPETVLRAAFDGVLAARGPVPRVRLATLPDDVDGAGVTGTAGSAASTRRGLAEGSSLAARRRRAPAGARIANEPPQPRPIDLAAWRAAADSAPELPPFPEIGEGVAIEDVLLRLKQHLEKLYQAVGSGPGGSR